MPWQRGGVDLRDCRWLPIPARMAELVRTIGGRRGGGHRFLQSRANPVLTAAGLGVVEVDRPDRSRRRIREKSDQLDAISALVLLRRDAPSEDRRLATV